LEVVAICVDRASFETPPCLLYQGRARRYTSSFSCPSIISSRSRSR
jgi:hypothetical protein